MASGLPDRGKGSPADPSPADSDLRQKARHFILGPARDLNDRSLFHRLALIPLLAWVGLGSDGLSSSCYGPEEAFRMLGQYNYLAVAIAAAMTLTICVIAIAYSRVIEHFPTGGGGYVVAHKLLGEKAGVISGCALFVDYILTITVSIAAAGDALLSLLPLHWQHLKLPLEFSMIAVLLVLNLRGVKESVVTLAPIFVAFVLSHVAMIVAGILIKAPDLPRTVHELHTGLNGGLATVGAGGLFLIFIHAYSLGGGTYTGIEAVSNGLPIMREPKVNSGKKTMLYMAASLSFTASGLIICYLLWGLEPTVGKTMNALLAQRLAALVPHGGIVLAITLIAEGALLVVGAQTGFVDGPRVLSNMALDSWAPRRFSALSEQLTMQNGIMFMGIASLAVLLYTGGDVRRIVIMYSINVFLTFTLTQLSMCRFWVGERRQHPDWIRKISIHVVGLFMCLTIFLVTLVEKFLVGGWITIAVTGTMAVLCWLIHRHYLKIGRKLDALYHELKDMAMEGEPNPPPRVLAPGLPTAAVLVSGFSGVGIHTVLNAWRMMPNYFQNLLFLSVGVVDSGGFKGSDSVQALSRQTENNLNQYLEMAKRLGIPAMGRSVIGTDAIDEAEKLCIEAKKDFPHATFFAGKVVFRDENWYERILHNQSAFAIQKRLQLHGLAMIIIPAVLR